jgi:hypothetical protein
VADYLGPKVLRKKSNGLRSTAALPERGGIVSLDQVTPVLIVGYIVEGEILITIGRENGGRSHGTAREPC